MHTALQDNQKLKNYAGIIKNEVEISQKLKFCFHIPVGIYKSIFSSLNSLWNFFDSSNTMLKLLVILFIILLFDFGLKSPMGLT